MRGLVACVLVGLAIFAGCSSGDSNGSGGRNDGGGTGGSAGAADAATNQCANAVDSVAVNATYTVKNTEGGTSQLTVPRIAKQCGVDCLFSYPADEAAQDKCATDCVIEETGHAVSDSCVGCVIASVKCGRTYCTDQCLSTDNTPCDQCVCGGNQFGVNCLLVYEACAGVKNTVCTADGGA